MEALAPLHDRTRRGQACFTPRSRSVSICPLLKSSQRWRWVFLADLVTCLLVIAHHACSTIEARLGPCLLVIRSRGVCDFFGCRAVRIGHYPRAGGSSASQRRRCRKLQGLEVVQMLPAGEHQMPALSPSHRCLYRKAWEAAFSTTAPYFGLLEWVFLDGVAVVLALGGWMVTHGGGWGLGHPHHFILFSPAACLDRCAQFGRERFTQIRAVSRPSSGSAELLEEPNLR